jgi:tetratricopeptide (TPR) repeat protein
VYLESLRTVSNVRLLTRGFPIQNITGALGDSPLARKFFEGALRADPDSAVAHNNLAWSLAMDPGRTAEEVDLAVQHARRAVELEDSALNWNTLAVAAYRAGELRTCLEAADQSIATGGGYEADWLVTAMALHRLGRDEEARTAYDRGMRMAEETLAANEVIGVTAEEVQRFVDEARELMGEDR